MRVKTSITLPEETLQTIDRMAGENSNRSRFIEEAVASYVAQRERASREARDLEILNRKSKTLNREVADALAFQADL